MDNKKTISAETTSNKFWESVKQKAIYLPMLLAALSFSSCDNHETVEEAKISNVKSIDSQIQSNNAEIQELRNNIKELESENRELNKDKAEREKR